MPQRYKKIHKHKEFSKEKCKKRDKSTVLSTTFNQAGLLGIIVRSFLNVAKEVGELAGAAHVGAVKIGVFFRETGALPHFVILRLIVVLPLDNGLDDVTFVHIETELILHIVGIALERCHRVVGVDESHLTVGVEEIFLVILTGSEIEARSSELQAMGQIDLFLSRIFLLFEIEIGVFNVPTRCREVETAFQVVEVTVVCTIGIAVARMVGDVLPHSVVSLTDALNCVLRPASLQTGHKAKQNDDSVFHANHSPSLSYVAFSMLRNNSRRLLALSRYWSSVERYFAGSCAPCHSSL